MKNFFITILSWAVLLAASYGIWNCCVNLYTQHNDFPLGYHPDEWSKGRQITDGDRNFNHPQLMLEAADLVRARDPNASNELLSVVISGRNTSAYLAAGAAVFIAWAGWFAARWIGFVLAAIGGGLCPSLLAHAHYFKEEPALCFGVGAVLCFAAAMSTRRHWVIMLIVSILLGGACGTAASGKYAGAIMIIPGLLMVLMSTLLRGRWWLAPICVLLFAGGAVQTWSWINWRAVEDWQTFASKYEQEKEHATTEHSGVTMDRPNGYFLDAIWTEAMPHIKVFAVLAPLLLVMLMLRRFRMWRQSRALPVQSVDIPPPLRETTIDKPIRPKVILPWQPSSLFGWWLILTLAIYTVGLSYSVIPFFRYALPSVLMLNVLALLAAAWLLSLLGRPWWMRSLVTIIVIATIGVAQWGRCQDFNSQFDLDSRKLLPRWIGANLTGTVRIVADGYTNLSPDEINSSKVQAIVQRNFYAANYGSTVADLRRSGVQYVAVASASYDRWIGPYSRAAPYDSEGFSQKRAFYRDLFSRYPVVKEWKPAHPMYCFTNPDITLFKIDEEPR